MRLYKIYRYKYTYHIILYFIVWLAIDEASVEEETSCELKSVKSNSILTKNSNDNLSYVSRVVLLYTHFLNKLYAQIFYTTLFLYNSLRVFATRIII